MMSLPSPPTSDESFSALMVTLSSPYPIATSLSVRDVSLSFSSASFELASSSLRKIDLVP